MDPRDSIEHLTTPVEPSAEATVTDPRGMEKSSFPARIRTRLILLITGVITTLILILSFIYIQWQRNTMNEQLEQTVEMMKADLVKRGRAITKNVEVYSENAIATYDFSFVNDLIDLTVREDEEAIFGILMDNTNRVLAHSDKSLTTKVLDGPEDMAASQVNRLTVREYRRGNENVLEVITPLFMKLEHADGTTENERMGTIRFGFSLGPLEQAISRVQKHQEQRINKVWLIALFIMLGSLILGIGAAFLVGQRISRPIERLSHEAVVIGRGDLEHSIVPETKDEIGMLAENLEIMRRAIKELLVRTEEKARMEAELKTAQAVQSALFPKEDPKMDGYDLASFYKSATETGGDWFGFLRESDEHLHILIGDVTGHGTPSALITATARSTCSTLGRIGARINMLELKPSTILHYLNDEILDSANRELCMTFFASRLHLSKGRLIYSNAGHVKPMVFRRQNGAEVSIDVLQPGGIRLGDLRDAEYGDHEYQLCSGDLLFYYTDGLIEGTNAADEEYGKRRLTQVIKDHLDDKAESIRDVIVESVFQFYGETRQIDDITFIVLKVGGKK